jgi:hypothetical protein
MDWPGWSWWWWTSALASMFTWPDALWFFFCGGSSKIVFVPPSTTGWMCAELPRGLTLNTCDVLKQNFQSFSFHRYQFCASELR